MPRLPATVGFKVWDAIYVLSEDYVREASVPALLAALESRAARDGFPISDWDRYQWRAQVLDVKRALG